MPRLEHKHGITYYKTKGRRSADNIPLIFLHGGPGGTHDVCKPLLKLSKTRKVIIYDQIGGGKSSPLSHKKMKIATFIEELDTLISTLKLDEFHLGGASWGTTLALEYYLKGKQREKIRSLIFQSPMFSAQDWEKDAISNIKKLDKQTQKVIKYCHEINACDSKVYKEAVYKYYLKHVLRNKKKLDELMLRRNENGARVYEYMWGPSEFKPTGTLSKYNRIAQLKKIKVPTLLICGEHDEAAPKTVRKYSRLIKHNQFEVVAGGSHALLQEKESVMVNMVGKFCLNADK